MKLQFYTHKIFKWLIIILPFSITACKKFLDEKPMSSITTDNAYVSADDIEAALNGSYSSFMGTNYYQWEIFAHTDIRSDNAYSGGSNDIDYYQLDLNNIPNTNGSAYRAWVELYAAIAKTNSVLQYVKTIEDPALTEERSAQITGEASFLRAFHYYQLVSLFGGVPLERNSNSADPSLINLPKATEAEAYQFIDSNLQVAVSTLPYSYGAANIDKVRATKGAAYALLAKIWAQRPDRDYKKVSLYCDSVIDGNGHYSLLTKYSDLFDGEHHYNAESIMEIPFIANTPQANWGTEMLYPTHEGGVIPGTWQRYCVPSRALVAAFDAEGDVVRKRATISFEVAPWGDDYWNPCSNGSITIPFPYKYHNPSNWSGGDHTYLLRLADIILLKAEALGNAGDIDGALVYLNQVRARAGLNAITSATQTSLKTSLLKERQLELAFEWQRWNDLKRYGVAVDVMNNLGETIYTCNGSGSAIPSNPVNYNFNENKTWLPIPLLELQANPNLVQNTGY